MKICYLCPDLGIPVDGHKGASSHIRGFVNALKNQGNEILLITSQPVKEGTIDVPVRVIPQPSLVNALPKEEAPRTFRALRHLFYNFSIEGLLKEVITQEKPDLIYERYSPFSFAGGAVAKQFSIPHVLEVNAPLAEQGKTFRKQALQDASEFLELTALRQASLIFILSDDLKEWLMSLGISEEKIKIRPSGVDVTKFQRDGNSFKDRYKDQIVLGFVGSLKPWHDIELLSRVFRELASDPKYHLLVVGDGPMRQTIEELSTDFPGRVTATGAIDQEEVPKYIRTMDIALAPYPKIEPFYFSPLKVYEYMAMGRAVVATGIGQLNSLIDHNKNGCLVAVGDVEGWVSTIETLVTNGDMLMRLGDAAAEEIKLRHTWEKRAQTFMNSVENYVPSLKKEGALSS